MAVIGLLCHCPHHLRVEAAWEALHDLRKGEKLLFHNRPHSGELTLSGFKGEPTRQHLVDGHAERIEICPPIEVMCALDLLRRHVVQCPGNSACHRCRRVGLVKFGQPEVGHLYGPLLGKHDVAGLDVAVDDANAMGVVEGSEGLDDDGLGLGP